MAVEAGTSNFVVPLRNQKCKYLPVKFMREARPGMLATPVELGTLEVLPPPTIPPKEFVIRPVFPILGSTPGPRNKKWQKIEPKTI